MNETLKKDEIEKIEPESNDFELNYKLNIKPNLVVEPQILTVDIVKQYDVKEFIALLIINKAYRELIALEIQKETEQKKLEIPSNILAKGSETIISWAEKNLSSDSLDNAYNKAISLDSPLDTILELSLKEFREIFIKDSIPYRIESILKQWYSDKAKEQTKTKLQELGFNSQEEYNKARLKG